MRSCPATLRGLELIVLVSLCARIDGQLSVNEATYNPFAGQGVPPDDISVEDFVVEVGFDFQKLIAVDAVAPTFAAEFYWILSWEDPRAVQIMQSNYTTCSFYCHSIPSTILNSAGQPACCDQVFVPQAEATSLAGYANQEFPRAYQFVLGQQEGLRTFPESNKVSYVNHVQGTFGTALEFDAYPWDKHYLCIDVETAFVPVLEERLGLLDRVIRGGGAGATHAHIVEAQAQGPPSHVGDLQLPTRSVNLAEWQVGKVWMDILEFSAWTSPSAKILDDGYLERKARRADFQPVAVSPNNTTTGVRMCVEVFRQQRSYSVSAVLLPLFLIVLFSFGVFSFPRKAIKARVDFLATIFLTLIILQYVLHDVAKYTFQLTAPLWLILVSYALVFLLLVLSKVHNYMQLPEKKARRQQRLEAKGDFRAWKRRLQRGRPRPENLSQTLRIPTGQHAKAQDSQAKSSLEGSSSIRGPELAVPVKSDVEKEGVPLALQQNPPWLHRIGCFRQLSLLRTYAELEESHCYVDRAVQRFETYARAVLLVVYLTAVGLICGIAYQSIERSARYHTLPN